MKKLLFLSFALITGASFAQVEATGTAAVNAEIVAPISIVSNGTIDFGRIAAGVTGGGVTVSTEGERTGPTEMLMPGETFSNATFEVNAANSYTYNLALTGTSLSLEDGEGSATTNMEVTYMHDKGDEESFVGNGDIQQFNVGGVLTVNPNQPAGRYSGEVYMTVAYE